MTPKQKRLLASLGLLDLSLVLLWLGGGIQFDDTSGDGFGDWNLPICFLAFLAIGGAVVLAWPDRVARKAVGLTLIVVAGAMVMFGMTVEGFRFVYAPFEAEYVALAVVIALGGIALAAPPRVFVYAVAVVVGAALGLRLGYTGGEAVCGEGADECALAGMGSLFVAGVGVVLVLTVVAVIESRRASYAKMPPRAPEQGR